MTIEDVYEDWLRWKRRNVKGSSVGRYRRLWTKVLAPRVGRRNAEEMTARDWRSLFYDLEDGGLGLPTCQAACMLSKELMRHAEEELELRVASRWSVKWPKDRDGRALDIYASEEVRVLLSHLADHVDSGFHLLVGLAVYTGMRIGELCALRYEDIDERRMRVRVARTLTEDEDGSPALGDPKTASSVRTIPICRDLTRMVCYQKRLAPTDAYIARWREGCLPHYLMVPLLTDSWRKRYRHFVTVECGLRYVNPHGLRHTFATTMIEGGADVKTTQTLLGHANVSTTLDTYCHTTERAKREAIDSTVGAAFRPKKVRETRCFPNLSEGA